MVRFIAGKWCAGEDWMMTMPLGAPPLNPLPSRWQPVASDLYDWPSQITANRMAPGSRYLPWANAYPTIHPTATVRSANITGDVRIGPGAHIVNAMIRADEGTPFHIGAGSNVQDGVVIHAHNTQEQGLPVTKNLIEVPGKGQFSVYIGDNVSLAHQVLVHGPSAIGDNTFVGFKATVQHSQVGRNVEIGPHAYLENVTIPDNVGIAAGAIITKPEDIPRFLVPLKGLNPKIAAVNHELALAYRAVSPR
jgi:carbonic anhydrase/acetyltransferase-like protein (isoleucine patch superfamily)